MHIVDTDNQAHFSYVQSLKDELIDMYHFTSEELKKVHNWGFIIRSVAEFVPLDQPIETYEYAWYLRGDRSDLPPHLQFEGFARVDGRMTEEGLASIGRVAVHVL